MEQQVENQFTILRPVQEKPRLDKIDIRPGNRLPFIPNEVTALDIETKGVEPWKDDTEIVGIGISNSHGSYYFYNNLQNVIDKLREYNTPLIAHNLFFDGAFILAKFGVWLNWKYCTYALYKYLATEGWAGQRWGLKEAQRDLLGWEESNEKDLDAWLVKSGYISNIAKEEREGYVWIEEDQRWKSPKKGEMWRAPAGILGKYCALDADSTWQLYTRVLEPALSRFPALKEFSEKYFLTLEKGLIDQMLSGLRIDRSQLYTYMHRLGRDIEEREEKFLSHKDIEPHINRYMMVKQNEYAAKEPDRYLKQKKRTEPSKYRKDGSLSKNWTRWKELEDQPPVVSKNWIKWNDNRETWLEKNAFNINSGEQKRWLFYDCLGYTAPSETESGLPSVDSKALRTFGEHGKLLIDYNEREKVLQFVESLLEKSEYDGRFHPQFRVPGTYTCRLSGAGGLNPQNPPKDRGFLETWIPDIGYTWIDYDVVALEMVVLAELSRDPNLWKIYGPNAKKNDIYLYNAAHLPGLGEKIRAEGYDPDNPDPEIIAHVKKVCKKERAVSKVITLGSGYGMGAKKLRKTLEMQGISISKNRAYELYNNYWKLYSGVKTWEEELLRQWKDNKGWLLNGIGRPIGVAADYEKDIVNRVVQSTGHDILVMYIHYFSSLLNEEGIPWQGILLDFHDESLIQVPEEYAERANEIMRVEAPALLNEVLGAEIPMKFDGGFISNFAEAKLEE